MSTGRFMQSAFAAAMFGAGAGTILAGGSVNCPAGVATPITTSPLPAIADFGTYEIAFFSAEDILFGATLPTALTFTAQVTNGAFIGTDPHGVNPLLYGQGGGISQINNLWRYTHYNQLSNYGGPGSGVDPTKPASMTMLVTPTGAAVHIVRTVGMVGQQTFVLVHRKSD